ncbi:unnamed protein product [Laminaria digitata]
MVVATCFFCVLARLVPCLFLLFVGICFCSVLYEWRCWGIVILGPTHHWRGANRSRRESEGGNGGGNLFFVRPCRFLFPCLFLLLVGICFCSGLYEWRCWGIVILGPKRHWRGANRCRRESEGGNGGGNLFFLRPCRFGPMSFFALDWNLFLQCTVRVEVLGDSYFRAKAPLERRES